MKRRDFLKVSSLMSAVGYAAVGPVGKIVNLDIETAAFGKIYRGTSKGKIFTSTDKGKSWQLHTQFSPGYSVLDIFIARDKRLYIQLGYKQVSFYLVLTKDGKAWSAQSFKALPKPKA